jgi:phage baseplate assembly protein gpV
MADLVCTLQLSKTPGEGLTLTILNKDDDLTQTVTMDGTTLTLTVARGDVKSTFTQTADAIAIKCTTFSVEADKIDLTGAEQVRVSAPAVKIAADGTFEAEATGIATLKGSIANVQGNLVNLG